MITLLVTTQNIQIRTINRLVPGLYYTNNTVQYWPFVHQNFGVKIDRLNHIT